MLNILRRSRAEREVAEKLLAAIFARARERVFFEALGIADTLDGRFDLATLHAWMVLEALSRLKRRAIAQRLTDALFERFDEGLRELGAGDIGMGRRMKQMANAFYGRLGAYRAASDEAMLSDAIHRNVYRGAVDRADAARALARYVETASAALSACDVASGHIDFGPLPPV